MPKNNSLLNTNYIQAFDQNDNLVTVQWGSVLQAMSESNVSLFGIPFNRLPQRLAELTASEAELKALKETIKAPKLEKAAEKKGAKNGKGKS